MFAIDHRLKEEQSAREGSSWRRKEMNARYPARPAGMFGPVNRTHVVAALAAALGVVAGAAGAAAWDVADSDDAYRVYSPPAINIDRVAEQAAVNDAAPIATGVSGA